ncbi:MAG TPA: NAD(+)--rifampin ADP-ribosyltransferase [Bradyrhizobium sp.]|nr:NAD(+)--rifampin ADP-ribosyltransferase [Bradyrhizobium sp.]
MRTRYFHGGNRGLRVGQYILPQSETGVQGMSHPLCRKDRVYFTPHIDHARFFGAAATNPVVYEVAPEGEIEHDPDTPQGISYASPKAKIIAIQKIPGKVIKKHRKKLQIGPPTAKTV